MKKLSVFLARSAGKLRVRKDSHGLVIRGFMEEAGTVLDLKDFGWAERKGGHLKSKEHSS